MNEKDEQLCNAVRKLDLDLVKKLIDEGANLNGKIGSQTLLGFLSLRLPEWRRKNTEKYDKGRQIREALERAARKSEKE